MSANKSQFNDNYHQGYYKLLNPLKYMGDPNNIKYRSSWELAFCKYLDNKKSIIKWGVEMPVITYTDLLGKIHRYYPDYYYEERTNDDDKMKRVVAEIKPKKELYPPEKPLKESNKALSSYEYSLKTFITNKLKWEASVEYCRRRDMEFILITEQHLKRAGLIPNK